MVTRSRRRTLAELATRDLKGVEILAPGTWNGDVYTTDHLDAMVAAFPTLRGTIDPPGKLGHDRTQALAQVDGFPAIGWVDRLYRDGDKLLADFVKVPAMVGDLIAAGGYDKVSAEMYFDKEINGTTFPRVLRAVSFLGGDLPAVKSIRSISDVAKLYTDGEVDLHAPEYEADERSLEDDSTAQTTVDAAIADAITDTLTAKIGTLRHRGILTEAEEGDLDAAVDAALSAFKAQAPASVLAKPIAGKIAAGYYTWRDESHREATMDRKDLIKALSLKDDATDEQVAEAVKAAGVTLPTVKVDPPAGAYLSEEAGRQLTEDVGRLTRELGERNVADVVRDALRAGKIVPAQEEWAKGYAARDLAGFKSYAETAPVQVKPPSGFAGDVTQNDTKEPTETAKSLAEQLGTPAESLARAATNVPTSELAKEQAAARHAAAVAGK